MRFALDGTVPPLVVAVTTMVLIAWRQGYLRGSGRSGRIDVLMIGILVALTAAMEWQMGRPLTYRHGPVRFWSGNIKSDQNSQQLTDPYTFTHVIHGAAFYGLTRIVMPPASIGLRLLVTTGIEAAWEAYENTDTVVNRYRASTISLGYYGDSLINSVCDIAACLIGFWLTAKLPRQATWAWVVAVEVVLAFWIRDNLTLNVIMLLHPFEFIRHWQMGA